MAYVSIFTPKNLCNLTSQKKKCFSIFDNVHRTFKIFNPKSDKNMIQNYSVSKQYIFGRGCRT
jgi:hypothetical protein